MPLTQREALRPTATELTEQVLDSGWRSLHHPVVVPFEPSQPQSRPYQTYQESVSTPYETTYTESDEELESISELNLGAQRKRLSGLTLEEYKSRTSPFGTLESLSASQVHLNSMYGSWTTRYASSGTATGS